MADNSENLRKLGELRKELARAMQPPTPDRGAIKVLRAEISDICSRTTQNAVCPFCGRPIIIPPYGDARIIGCRRCRNTFTYDPFTDAISISRAPFQKNAQHVDAKWFIIAAVIIILGGVLVFFRMSPEKDAEPAPVVNGEPAATLDEVQKHLKALSE